jgi:hypothetical protein
VEDDQRVAVAVELWHQDEADAVLNVLCSIAASGCQVPLTGSKRRPRAPPPYTASAAPVASLATRGCGRPCATLSCTGIVHAPAPELKRVLITTPEPPPGRGSFHTTTALPLASTARSKSSMSASLASILMALPHAAVAAR